MCFDILFEASSLCLTVDHSWKWRKGVLETFVVFEFEYLLCPYFSLLALCSYQVHLHLDTYGDYYHAPRLLVSCLVDVSGHKCKISSLSPVDTSNIFMIK